MKNVVIIGVGNFAKIVREYILDTREYRTKQWQISGFLNSDVDIDCSVPQETIIGDLLCYSPGIDDVFICSYIRGIDRMNAVNIITDKGGRFINVIHSLAYIASSVEMGTGNIVGAYATLSVDVRMGNHNIVQNNSNIGHDTIISDCSHFYVGTVLSGKNNIGRNVSVYTGSIIYPSIKIEDDATVGAGSVVMRKVKCNTTVLGNPAKLL